MTSAELDAYVEKIRAVIEDWGDLSLDDEGANRTRRLIRFTLLAPGSDLPIDVETVYTEWYACAGASWDLSKYTYERIDRRVASRLAYHWHDIAAIPDVFHAHCGPFDRAAEPTEQAHFRATEVGLLEAHDEFMRLYAADAAPDCGSFRPLEVAR